jgi:hypothetical protein
LTVTDNFLFLNYTLDMFFKQIPTYIYIVVIAFAIMALGVHLSKVMPQAKTFFVSRVIEDIDDIAEMAESQNESPPAFHYQQRQPHEHNQPPWTLNQQQVWPNQSTQTRTPYVKTFHYQQRQPHEHNQPPWTLNQQQVWPNQSNTVRKDKQIQKTAHASAKGRRASTIWLPVWSVSQASRKLRHRV